MPSVLAIAAHPDDIEFVMAGTMLHLKARGWDVHYLNICDGSKGSTQLDPETCAATRRREAQKAAALLGATFYEPIWPDMELHYSTELVQQVAAVLRQSKASVVLTHSPIDYMEDHEYACRLAVTAAFTHGMPNFATVPPIEPYFDPVTVYHAQPHGNRTPMGERVRPHFWVNTTGVIQQKETALAAHASQQEWLDSSQGMNSYLKTMWDLGADSGKLSGKYPYAEGWRRREHWGFCGADDDPLRKALHDLVVDDTPRDP